MRLIMALKRFLSSDFYMASFAEDCRLTGFSYLPACKTAGPGKILLKEIGTGNRLQWKEKQ